ASGTGQFGGVRLLPQGQDIKSRNLAPSVRVHIPIFTRSSTRRESQTNSGVDAMVAFFLIEMSKEKANSRVGIMVSPVSVVILLGSIQPIQRLSSLACKITGQHTLRADRSGRMCKAETAATALLIGPIQTLYSSFAMGPCIDPPPVAVHDRHGQVSVVF